jgi:hypothetical protein
LQTDEGCSRELLALFPVSSHCGDGTSAMSVPQFLNEAQSVHRPHGPALKKRKDYTICGELILTLSDMSFPVRHLADAPLK